MEQRGIARSTGEWFLIASRGDMVARVRPGMLLGETAAGELTFDRSSAQLELDIAGDGSIVLSAVDDYELESAGGTRSRRESLARYRGVEIHLPHNVLQLDTDFADPVESDETVKIRIVGLTETIAESPVERKPDARPEDPADTAGEAPPPRPATSKSKPGGAGDADVPPPARTPRPATSKSKPAGAGDADVPPPARTRGIPQPSRPPAPRPTPSPAPDRATGPTRPRPAERTVDEKTVNKSAIRPGSANRRAERTGVRRQRTLRPLMAALIGLAVVGLALLYPVLREGRITESPATVDAVPATQTGPVQAPEVATDVATESSAPDSEVVITPVRLPPLPLRLLDLPAPEATDTGAPQQVAERPSGSLPEPEPTAAPPVEPIVLSPVEQRSIPSPAETTEQPTRVAETEVAAEAVDYQPDPAFVAGLEEIGVAALNMAEELARRRDLLAADLALAQGRLTSPPEASAYTLYNRVLAQDPESPDARSGLQSVRQGLTNRALAQLAGGQLDDARGTLQAAADAGADPRLVADLKAEVDYRQRLTNGQNQ